MSVMVVIVWWSRLREIQLRQEETASLEEEHCICVHKCSARGSSLNGRCPHVKQERRAASVFSNVAWELLNSNRSRRSEINDYVVW